MNKYKRKYKLLKNKKELTKKEERSLLKNFLKWKGDKDNSYAYFSDFVTQKIDWKNKTVYDLDKEDYEFQKNNGTLVSNSYSTLYLNSVFASFIEQGFIKEPVNGIIISAQYYILNNVLDKLNNYIDKKIPNIFRRNYGKDLFTKDPNSEYFIMTVGMEVVAMGNEEKLKQLKDIVHDMYWEIFDYIELVCNEKNITQYTFVKENSNKYDCCSKEYIVGGIPAAKKIKYDSFLKDFYQLEQSIGYIKQIEKDVYRVFKKKLKKKMR